MEISPQVTDDIKNCMSFLMNDDDVAAFSDCYHAIAVIKQAQPCWQAPASIGVQAAVLHLTETDTEKAVLQGLIAYAHKPLEALLDSLVPESDKEALEDERAHLLFHTCFGFGFLLLARGEKERAKTVLHQMVATRLPTRGVEVRAGPGIIRQTLDITRGKLLAALFMQQEYEAEGGYGEALYLVTEAVACNPWATQLLQEAPVLLDHWAERCEKEDASEEYEFPTLQWLDLFAEAAEVLSVCQEADSSGALPNECKEESAQFLAWKFGQIAGKLAVHDRWCENPVEAFAEFLKDPPWEEGVTFSREGEKVQLALNTVRALLCEYEPNRDWEKIREHYISMWNTCYTYRGTSLAELTPESDLYWAMRIGFVDKMLETQPKQLIAPLPTEKLETIGTRTSLNVSKILQEISEIKSRLPPPTEEIRVFIADQLSGVWDKLPPGVADALVEAEQSFQVGTRTQQAILDFHKAAEECLRCYFVDPLVTYMVKQRLEEMTLHMRARGKARPIRIGANAARGTYLMDPRRLSLRDWAGLFEMLADPEQEPMVNLSMKMFIKQSWLKFDFATLKQLVEPLKKIQEYRNHAAHRLLRPHMEERNKLEEMRRLLLGMEQTSVIAQIFKRFAPETMPHSNSDE